MSQQANTTGSSTVAFPLSSVVVEWDDYPREDLDEDRVLEFRELLRDAEADSVLPPVELVPHPDAPDRFLIADGFHRYHAHLDEGRDTIPAVLLPRGTDVFLHGVRRAAISAKPLTRVEKRAAVVRLLTEHPDWSNRQVADAAAVSRPFVAQLRSGGNVAPSQSSELDQREDAKGGPSAESKPDLARQAVWQLVESYRLGFGRTKLGLGAEIQPDTIRSLVELLDEEQSAHAVKALRAWGRALADERAWLPGGTG